MQHFQFVALPVLISRGPLHGARQRGKTEHRKAPLCIGYILKVMHIISVLIYLAKIAICQRCWRMRNQLPVTPQKNSKSLTHINIVVRIALDNLKMETVMKILEINYGVILSKAYWVIFRHVKFIYIPKLSMSTSSLIPHKNRYL